MVHYKLYYFNIRGLAEPIRLLFNYVKEPFQDIRIEESEWYQTKSKFFYGKVPVLEIDGDKQLNQSSAILRYLGEKYGLMGKDEFEKAKVNEIIDFHKDVYNIMSQLRKGDLERLRNAEHFFSIYVKLLKQSGSGFLLPSGLTIADFVIAEYLDQKKISEPELLNQFPELVKYIGRVNSLPQIREYVTKRTE